MSLPRPINTNISERNYFFCRYGAKVATLMYLESKAEVIVFTAWGQKRWLNVLGQSQRVECKLTNSQGTVGFFCTFKHQDMSRGWKWQSSRFPFSEVGRSLVEQQRHVTGGKNIAVHSHQKWWLVRRLHQNPRWRPKGRIILVPGKTGKELAAKCLMCWLVVTSTEIDVMIAFHSQLKKPFSLRRHLQSLKHN